MDYIVWDPTALNIVFGVVLGFGAVLGFIVGRNLRRLPKPSSPNDFDRRMRVIEEELELVQSELSAFREERDFLRRLRPDHLPQKKIPKQTAA